MMLSRAVVAPMLLCLLVIVTGCKMFEPPTHPHARVSSYKISSLDADRAEIDYQLRVSNPLDVAVPLMNVDYEVKVRNAILEQKRVKRNELVPARGSITLKFPVSVNLNDLPVKDRNIRPGDTIYLTTVFTSQVLMPDNQPYQFPARRSVRIPYPAEPDISISEIIWTTLNDNQATGTMVLRIENTNQYEITINSLNYTLGFAGKEVSGGGESQRITLKRNETQYLSTNINFSPRSIDRSLLRFLRRSYVDYGIYGTVWTDNQYRFPMKLKFKDQGRAKVKLP